MRSFVFVISFVLAQYALAGEAEVRKAFEEHFPESQIKSVTKSPVAGLYEFVVDDNQILYVDEGADHLILGNLIDAKSRKNLTREKMDKLMAIPFDSLPLKNAIKFVQGNGKRQLAVFSDPDCPFCKKLEPELTKLNNVTIYLFPYPIAGLHPDAARKAKLAWCAKDRAQAWRELVLKGKEPKAGNCDNPVDENVVLGQKLGINGTPTLVFANGRRVPGYIPGEQIESLLKDSSK